MATLKPTSVSFPPELETFLRQEAEQRGVPVSAVVRWAVAERYKYSPIIAVAVASEKHLKSAAKAG